MGRDPQGLGNLWNWSVAPSPVGGQDVDAGFDGAQAGQVDVLEGEVRRGGGGGPPPPGGGAARPPPAAGRRAGRSGTRRRTGTAGTSTTATPPR